MPVGELLQALLFTPDVQVVSTPLPHSMVRVMVHGRRQFEPAQHLPAPRESGVAPQGAQNEIGSTLRKLLHDLGRVGKLARPEEKMAMLGHKNVADNAKARFGSKIAEGLGKLQSKTVRVKKCGRGGTC